MPLEKDLQDFNEAASKEEITRANDLINASLGDAAGTVYGQKTKIQFNTLTYERIIEFLHLLFVPEIDNSDVAFRSMFENSLGYNNLIYIATILAEFEGLKECIEELKHQDYKGTIEPKESEVKRKKTTRRM